MAQIIQRSDRFPVGTQVKAFAGATPAQQGKPAGPVVETATVDALGRLAFNGLTAGVLYTLYAEVAGAVVKVTTMVSEPFTSTSTLQQRVRARRLAAGA